MAGCQVDCNRLPIIKNVSRVEAPILSQGVKANEFSQNIIFNTPVAPRRPSVGNEGCIGGGRNRAAVSVRGLYIKVSRIRYATEMKRVKPYLASPAKGKKCRPGIIEPRGIGDDI
jgi:hypothetical protein